MNIKQLLRPITDLGFSLMSQDPGTGTYIFAHTDIGDSLLRRVKTLRTEGLEHGLWVTCRCEIAYILHTDRPYRKLTVKVEKA